MLKLIITFLIFPLSSIAQQTLEIDLTFGVYMDDHAARTFDAKERIWKLKEDTLTYFIDAHGVRYSGTLKLTPEEHEKVKTIVVENQLVQATHKKMESPHRSKYGYQEVIRGNLQLGRKKAEIRISANSSSLMDTDQNSKNFGDLEQFFYQIIEAHP